MNDWKIEAAPLPEVERENFATPKPEYLADLLDDHAINVGHPEDYPYATRLMQEAAKLIRQLQTPPEAEPVAFVSYENHHGHEVRKAVLCSQGINLADGTLLYTHPAPPSELVKAARELIRAYDKADEWVGEEIEALRAALDKVKP